MASGRPEAAARAWQSYPGQVRVLLIVAGSAYALVVVGLFTRHLLWERWTSGDDARERDRSKRGG